MKASYTRKPVPHGFTRLRAGEVTRSGDVAPTDRPSLACKICEQVVLDHAPARAAHRRSHQAAALRGMAV